MGSLIPVPYQQAGSDAGSARAAGLDRQLTAEFGDAFPHGGDADPGPPALGHAHAVVADLQPQVLARPDRGLAAVRAGPPEHAGDCLRADPVARALYGSG